MSALGGFREMPDFIINDVLDLAEHSDRGIVPWLIRMEFAFASTSQT